MMHITALSFFLSVNTNWVLLREDFLRIIPQLSKVRKTPPHKVPDLRVGKAPPYLISEFSSLLYNFVASCLEYLN